MPVLRLLALDRGRIERAPSSEAPLKREAVVDLRNMYTFYSSSHEQDNEKTIKYTTLSANMSNFWTLH